MAPNQAHVHRRIETQPTQGHDDPRFTGIWKGGVFAISTAAGMAAIGGTLGTIGAVTGAVIGVVLVALLYFLDRIQINRRHSYGQH